MRPVKTVVEYVNIHRARQDRIKQFAFGYTARATAEVKADRHEEQSLTGIVETTSEASSE